MRRRLDTLRPEIERRLAAGEPVRKIARECGVDPHTVRTVRHGMRGGPASQPIFLETNQLPINVPVAPEWPADYRLPDPAPEAGGPALPDPYPLSYEPYAVTGPGVWGVLSDVHLPYHDRRTIELFVDECRRNAAAGVLLNGDFLDSHEVSDHQRERNAASYADEIAAGCQFLAWLRSRLPKARIIFKEGNHDARVQRYIFANAPALAGIRGVDLPSFLELDAHGVEWVGDKRPVTIGKLPVLHGHEYRGGGGVNPARWLYLRAGSTAMCGHFHRTSEHHERVLSQKTHGVWSVGCACYLHPRYMPLNQWNHGYAIVRVESDGWFQVESRRVLDGRAV